jgi:hypothetical protein
MNDCKKLFLTFSIFLAFGINAGVVEDEKGCKTKLIQMLIPDWPNANYQGYSIVSFNIDIDGGISKSKIKESKCAIARDENGAIIFETCPFFKKVSFAASKYLKYKKPINKEGLPCSIQNHKYKYNFSLYNIELKDSDFLLREEYEAMMYDSEKSK